MVVWDGATGDLISGESSFVTSESDKKSDPMSFSDPILLLLSLIIVDTTEALDGEDVSFSDDGLSISGDHDLDFVSTDDLMSDDVILTGFVSEVLAAVTPFTTTEPSERMDGDAESDSTDGGLLIFGDSGGVVDSSVDVPTLADPTLTMSSVTTEMSDGDNDATEDGLLVLGDCDPRVTDSPLELLMVLSLETSGANDDSSSNLLLLDFSLETPGDFFPVSIGTALGTAMADGKSESSLESFFVTIGTSDFCSTFVSPFVTSFDDFKFSTDGFFSMDFGACVPVTIL